MDNKSKLRALPKIDELVAALDALCEEYGRDVVTDCAREQVEDVRRTILSGGDCEVSLDALCARVADAMKAIYAPHLHAVVNATGVVLHTTLGRAVLSEAAARAAYTAARCYTNLEYDVEKGQRGSRYSHIERLLRRLTGAEGAMVVNNNAAAVLLILSTLARGKEVVVSRGELVEIGGAFRVPAIMEQSGGTLVEIGTTNKTHPYDYENAVTENTGAILKVHTSNFKITGFTEEVPLTALREIADRHGLPLIYDLGSGRLCDLTEAGVLEEPGVLQALADGADVVSFSGDKLLGGPQAGIIVGKKELIERMKKHPLTRAFRVDKMTFAALEETLRCYLDPTRAGNVPTIAMIRRPLEELDRAARSLRRRLSAIEGLHAAVVDEKSQVGGGSVPSVFLDTRAVAVTADNISSAALEENLRRRFSIICRVTHDRVLLDVRTLLEGDDKTIADALRTLCEEAK